MNFNKFSIYAVPHITDASCKCGANLKEVMNSLISRAWFCPKCESVYELKLVKTPGKKVNLPFLKQCRRAIEKETEGL